MKLVHHHILLIDDGVFRYFQRVRNNEVCEARGGMCKEAIDLFEKNLKTPNPIPSLLNLRSIEKLNFGQAFTTNKKMPCSKNLTRLMKMLPR